MVMEAPPNPQYVGREFVRQYYTLLNQAPAHLHRFYNNNSSFVHGGLDAPNRETKPVVGQKQIHQKIQQLNFRDCHAKISQVDSQATLGDGVVVQVTGELSNSGEPMRRFTQTFVLAAQSPKKYYVHNDIFRYQDMMFSDEDVEQDSGRSEADEDVETDHSAVDALQVILPATSDTLLYKNPQLHQQPAAQQPPSVQQQTIAYYSTATAATSNTAVPPQALTPTQMPTLLPHQLPAPAVPVEAVMNGSAHPEEIMSSAISVPVTVQSLPQQPLITSLQALQPLPRAPLPLQPAAAPPPHVLHPPSHPVNVSPPEEELPQPEAPAVDHEEEPLDPPAKELEEPECSREEEDKTRQLETGEQAQNETEPKTYATSLKSGGVGLGTATFASTIAASVSTPAKPSGSPPPVMSRSVERESIRSSSMSSSGPGVTQIQRGLRSRGGNIRGMGRSDRVGPGRGTYNEDSGVNNDGERRRMGPNMMRQYSDCQQLFMGNLPHHATEEDLKELFSKFGAIVDLRIHCKQNAKGVPSVPNYGFIIFEDASTVQQVLNSRPITFPSENGQKLNVEEKKNRLRQSMDMGRVGSGNDIVMGGARPNSGIGGPRAVGPGMMRGGPGMGHRGGGRGFSRGDGRGGGMSRGSNYTRR